MGSVIAHFTSLIVGLATFRPSDIVGCIKWVRSYFYIRTRRKCEERRFDIYDVQASGDAEKTNFINPKEEYVLESPVPECELHEKNDEVFFWGTNSKQEQLEVSLSRRSGHAADATVVLRLATGKTYRLQQIGGHQLATSDSKTYSCGGLQVYFISTMRRWRLFYNGYLKEIDDDGNEIKSVYVKFSVKWSASSDTFDYSTDISPNLLARLFADLPWKGVDPPYDEMQNVLNFYGQTGSMHGTVHIGDESTTHEIYLFGQRLKFFDSSSGIKDVRFQHILGYVPQNGSYLNLGIISSPRMQTKRSFGFFMKPDATICNVAETEVSLSGKNITSHFVTDRPFELNGTILEDVTLGMKSRDKISFSLNGLSGKGILFERNRRRSDERGSEVIYFTTLKAPQNIPLTVSFSDVTCQIPDVTGGKGSSLGKLTQFSNKIKTFIVPNGIVVTTAAYDSFTTKEILSKVKLLEDVLYENSPGDVKEVCSMVSEEIVRTNMPENISSAIVSNLKAVFGDDFHQKKFAVRSSATGEDTEQMSAAGQMETYLGVTGQDQVVLAVKKCWASQFGHIAVQYKRRYGQCLNSPMAVVVQEMVSCDRAGVLFTCDPLTGDPTRLTLTANYGLGESVVSGSEEPDTVTLLRDCDDELSVGNVTIGAKSHRIVVKEDEGTSLEDVPENERTNCCISDREALRLGQLSIEIEKLYRSSRDIEWGFFDSNLYIFQSRPVTSGSQETDFDIEHEFDGAQCTENEYFSISNIGEVMPGAYTPLGYQLFCRVIGTALQRDNRTEYEVQQLKYFMSGMMACHNHAMFNIVDLLKRTDEKNMSAVSQSVLIAFFGRILDDPGLFAAIRARYPDEKNRSSGYRVAKMLLLANYNLRKTLRDYSAYRIPVERFVSSKDLFRDLLSRCSDFYDAFTCHMICTQGSSIWNLMLMTILGKAHGGFDDVVYRDFASLLSTISDVESADVPSAMQSLAFHISKAIEPAKFKEMDSKEALEWLQTSSSTAGQKFRQFLDKHGHRCLKEFEVRTVTWGTNPEPLAKLLQNLVGNVSKDSDGSSKSVSISNIISKLNVPLGYFSRLALRVLLPFSRKAVQSRELSKSLIIKCMDHWRKGFVHLSKMMVSEGRLPDADLIFFLTLEDIRELLETRSPAVIAKAFHRRKRYPIMDKYMFPEIMKGFPVPINYEEQPEIANGKDFSMKGIPVSQGTAKGFVRVAMTLDEAAELKPGEILLTHGTDIGWTPYFPTLAGVVTELGGLISHGAVVSREYGIPCIAGLHGATRMFHTGEYVLLDGNKGVLQKLPPP